MAAISRAILTGPDPKVGSPLDKTISGGQRKRLNSALELIREPCGLFVDEAPILAWMRWSPKTAESVPL
ncbi:MAG: hypothetical protein KKC20_01755 [Proteobacteria bacterium]|nr:hypothetical protein [Pseudomonadota bacterium]